MNIVLLSDGTGNSSAKLFKTNVWRLYEALDLDPGQEQVARYDNGVGTASFKPLALLGGAFGLGLKRNLLDLYVFLCRNYTPGDRIYCFGFSRGAFTIRLLLGLIDQQGVIVGEHGADLDRFARWAYRAYRCRFNQTKGLVGPIRSVRNAILRSFDRLRGKRAYERIERVLPDIHFVGLWDTVDAYGLPVAELTDGWDRWIWPLTLRTSIPNQKVRKAFHALALDDERQTFHPLIWDERGEPQNLTSRHIDDERISQVWFAGMHSNVGGGYPDDAMSYESLHWIASEAVRRDLRLRSVPFVPGASILDSWRAQATPNSRMNDSRRGFAAYYRYSPRNVQRVSDDPKADTFIERPKIHESVFDRLRNEAADYEPIVIPRRYAVVRSTGEIQDQNTYGVETEAQADIRIVSQEAAWNIVWQRRVVYFATVAASLWLVMLPFLPAGWTRHLLDWALPSWSKVIGVAGAALPGLAGPWVSYFKLYPLQLLAFGGLVALLLLRGASLHGRIEDRMFEMWRASAKILLSQQDAALLRFRTAPSYRAFFHVWRQTIVPNVFGILMLAIFNVLGIAVVTNLVFDVTSLRGAVCRDAVPFPPQADGSWTVDFKNDQLCQATGIVLNDGARYEITLQLPSPGAGQWKDGDHAVDSVRGFPSDSFAFVLGLPFRRHLGLQWFVPMARVGTKSAEFYALDVPIPGDESQSVTLITARSNGQLFLYVNDALPPCPTWTWDCLYNNNHGDAAKVSVRPR